MSEHQLTDKELAALRQLILTDSRRQWGRIQKQQAIP